MKAKREEKKGRKKFSALYLRKLCVGAAYFGESMASKKNIDSRLLGLESFHRPGANVRNFATLSTSGRMLC